jgi:hypothetical protein
MRIADAQLDMRRTFRGGLAGQLVSAALWAASAACGTWGSHRLAAIVLVVGGFFIFPLTLLALRLGGRRAAPGPANPLNALAMQVAFTLPLGLPVVLTLAYYSPNRFYPAVMMLLGAHYLPFMFLYGMWQWAILAGVLLAGGYVLGWVAPLGFVAGGWLAAAALFAFALAGWRIVIAEERRAAA